MIPEIWGPRLWYNIHKLALSYPFKPTNDDINTYYNIFTNLWRDIPCEKCSVNYKRHLLELPIKSYLSSKYKLFEWTVKMHNLVNKELKKSEMSLQDALIMYKFPIIIDLNNYIFFGIFICLMLIIFKIMYK